jgi:hypothetical protein
MLNNLLRKNGCVEANGVRNVSYRQVTSLHL